MFSVDEFVDRICGTDCCFICGEARGNVKFNDEHIIPRWVLKRYGLFDRNITLPNGKQHKYGTYKMPCCKECNSLLGKLIEDPMREMLAGGFDAVNIQLRDPKNGPLRIKALYAWLCLLFIKTHLKDRMLREHLNYNKGKAKIADQYIWEMQHHIHCVARMPYVRGDIGPEVIGTLLWYRIKDEMMVDQFDYFDLTNDQTVVLRLGDVGLIAVLTDAGAAKHALKNIIMETAGQTLTMVQLRELAARLALASRQLINKPNFFTAVDRRDNQENVRICAERAATANFEAIDYDQLGEIMLFSLEGFIDNLDIGVAVDREEKRERIRRGDCSFIFDENMKFMNRTFLKPVKSAPA
ncbi:hypothetical protein LPB140_08905 [Sphingorhabdus lutea]|uniref:HNH endonuclease n=1 Tax=Sphingorhabdus lutea TaxID=1913578 RepID=A0A1L3JCM7_9SPHN|nr:hypothetical protein [Sphingorhabdus lutea]APG62888.1 hypothetical protein LPB140_08905 [Sphingorhabdus lutea]